MISLTETVLFYWDCIDISFWNNSQAAKNDVVGIGETKDWAGKLASAKLPSLVSSRSSAANSRHARSVSSTSKGRQAPPPSLCSSARYSSPTTNNLTTSEPVSDAPDGYPYIEGNDQVERKALPIASKVIPRQTNMMVNPICI